jgi:hypothetical protein
MQNPGYGKPERVPSDEMIEHQVKRAASGLGIVNLHHTITLFATERMSQFLNREECAHMTDAWVEFLQDKRAEEMVLEEQGKSPADYKRFFDMFSGFEAKPVVESVAGMIVSPEGRRQLGRYIVKAVVDRYRGDYNPHYITGLASVLWVVDRYWKQTTIALNALYQYLDFFFTDLGSQER